MVIFLYYLYTFVWVQDFWSTFKRVSDNHALRNLAINWFLCTPSFFIKDLSVFSTERPHVMNKNDYSVWPAYFDLYLMYSTSLNMIILSN